MKKHVRTFLFLLLMFAAFFHAAYAQTQTVEALTAQINELLGIVANLQVQLTELQGETPTSSVFTRDLKRGDSGEDVKNLQKILNSNIKTQIASSGDGSPGQETPYFGPLTEAAVARFQELYAENVLYPLGLSQGTGYVGFSTRTKLAEFLNAGAENTQNTAQNNNQTPTAQSEKVVIDTVTPEVITNGVQVVITGSGFTKEDNTVYTGIYVEKGLTSPDGKTLTFDFKGPSFNRANFDAETLAIIGEENIAILENARQDITYGKETDTYIRVENTSGISNEAKARYNY